MNFARSSKPLSFEASIAQEAERMRARREKAAQRRKARHAGHWDDQTVEVERPPLPATAPECETPGCERKARAKKGGPCAACAKRKRRAQGLGN